MKKIYISHTLLILLSFILFIGFSTNIYSQKNDIEEMNLKGKVKSLKKITYEVINKNNEIHKGEISKNPSSHLYHVFNKDGFNTEVYNYDTSNSELIFDTKNTFVYDYENRLKKKSTSLDGNLFSEKNYIYDGRGNLTEMTEYNSLGKLLRTNKYIYDDKGNKINEIDFRPDGSLQYKSIYKYDDQGNKIEWSWYDSDLNLIYKWKYKYNDKGYFIWSKRYYSNGKSDLKTTYKRNSNGIMIEWKNFQNGVLIGKENYKDDERGNLIEQIISEQFGLDKKIITCKYTYDKNNNWIKRINSLDKKPMSITERTIEYY